MGRPRFDKNWWTKERVKNGLLRFIRDIAKFDAGRLPKSVNDYHAMIPDEDVRRKLQYKIYPPPPAVSRHFGTMSKAWWELGYLVEVKAKEPKWPLTPEIEEMLRKIYSYDFGKRDRPKDIPSGPKAYAKQIGYPGEVITKFAIDLGLAKAKEKPWSIEEIKLLDKNGFYSVSRLQHIFSKHGFTRSKTAILLMRKRRMAHKSGGYFSATAISVLLGIDNHAVLRWLDNGSLKFINKGSKKRPQQGGDTRLIHRNWLYQFICEHPDEIDLHKVDQMWFLNLITKGRVQFVESTRLRKRHEASTIEKPIEFRKGTKAGRTAQTFFHIVFRCPCAKRTNVVPERVTRCFKLPLCSVCGRKANRVQIRDEEEKEAKAA